MKRPQSAVQPTTAALAVACVALIVAIASSGCQQKMASQPSYRTLEPSAFFPDQRSARPLVAGTVARGHLRTDLALFTGQKPRSGRNSAEQEPAPQPGSGPKSKFDENRDFVD